MGVTACGRVGVQKVGEDGGVALAGVGAGGRREGACKGERGKGREQAAMSSFSMPLNLTGAQQVYLKPKP